MKHLVVDARAALPQIDGLGTYLRQIVPPLVTAGERNGDFRTTLLVCPAMEAFWREAAPEARLHPSTVRPMHVGQNWRVAAHLAALRPDLYFYPAHDPPLVLRTPLVFTVHDLTMFQVRPYFETLDRAKRGYIRLVTPVGLARACAVFAVSEATKAAVGKTFGADLLDKVHVTLNGVCPPRAAVRDAQVRRDCLLYVGTDRPHKNLLRVIQAYAVALREAPDLPRLEIVGGLRSRSLLDAELREQGVEERVLLRGHLSDAELESCYARAFALVFPSLSEGFGLPILEAMIRDVPVITSNVSACAEVAGDAALTVDPLQVVEIARAIVRMFRDADLRERLIVKGRRRASEFTWQRAAAQTVAVLRDCLAGSRGAN